MTQIGVLRFTDSTRTILLFSLLYFVCVVESCTFPSDLSGTWISSNKGKLTFNSTHVDGLTFQNTGSVQVYECYLQSGTNYVLRSVEFTLFQVTFEAFVCIELEQLSPAKFRYFYSTGANSGAGNDPIKVFSMGTGTTINETCDVTPDAASWNFLLQEDQLSSASIRCPVSLLGVFNYTLTTGGTTFCAGDSSVDACTDNNTISFNYTTCPNTAAYSENGSVSCVYETTINSFTYVTTFNQDTSPDESTYFYFTCFVIGESGSEINATQHPQNCLSSQTATSVTLPGGAFVLQPLYTCEPATTTAIPTTTTTMVQTTTTMMATTTTAPTTTTTTTSTTKQTTKTTTPKNMAALVYPPEVTVMVTVSVSMLLSRCIGLSLT